MKRKRYICIVNKTIKNGRQPISGNRTMTTTTKSEKEILNNLSGYRITWVEITPCVGKAIKKDVDKLGATYFAGRRDACYRHFPTKEKAVAFVQGFDKKLEKQYTCRFFCDKQLKQRTPQNGYKVPFTTKQMEEVYTIGK